MIRLFLIVFVVLSLELGYQGIGLAFDCPSQPQQTGKDWEGEVNAAMAKIGPVSGGEVKTKAKAVTQDLLGKLPDAGKIYLEQMRYATICSSIRDDKSLSESEKRKQMREYDLETQKAIQQQTPKTKRSTGAPPLKQPGKEKERGIQLRVKPPVPPLIQAEPKLPETPSQSAASKSPSISQRSAGANSPNIMGDRNVVTYNFTDEAKIDEIRDLLRQKGRPDDPNKLLEKYPLGYAIYELTYTGQFAPLETRSVLNKYEKIDWSQAKVIENTKDRVTLRLPDLKRKDGTVGVTEGITGGPKKVGLLGCAFIAVENEGLAACGEILAIREAGIVFLVSLLQLPSTIPK